MKLRGRIWKFGDNMRAGGDILPTRYDSVYFAGRVDECIPGLMEDINPEFGKNFAKGDLILAGRNFGGGHGHYVSTALAVMRQAELGGVIAESAAITMIQKAVNSGFPVLEMAGITALAKTGDELEVDLRKGEAKNLTTSISIQITPMPDMIVDILEAGGLEPFAIRRLRR